MQNMIVRNSAIENQKFNMTKIEFKNPLVQKTMTAGIEPARMNPLD